MLLTIKEFGEICRILIYLRPLAEAGSHSARCPEVTNFSVVLHVYILCRIVFLTVSKSLGKPSKYFIYAII